jgi:hypothetical protein
MRIGRGISAIACVLAAVLLGGCACSTAPWFDEDTGESTAAAPAASSDRAGRALASAKKAIEGTVPDAVPVMLDTAGVVLNPPSEEWGVTFASPSTGHTYSVSVTHEKAEKPRDMGAAKLLSPEVLGKAVAYDSLKYGSDKAYETAKAELGKTGEVPPLLMQSVTLIEIPGLGSTPGVWQVSFLKSTSREGMRRANVDGMTGAVTVTK